MGENVKPRFHGRLAPFGPVASDLASVEELIAKQLAGVPPFLQPCARFVAQAGGKRLRPAAFLLMIQLLEEQVSLPHHVTGAVLELCHTASLLHDDVLDHAQVRRGRPALHRVRGNREAILFGDYLLAGAFQLLAELARPELISIMARLVGDVCAGEIRQWSQKSLSITEKEYLEVVKAKTASFFRYAGTLAGRFACLGKPHATALEVWGENFGVAYQIADDIYDLVAPPECEKTTGSDARCGILTLPWIRLRDREGLQTLRRRYLASVRKGPEAFQQDRIMKQAVLEAAQQVDHFVTCAQAALRRFSASGPRQWLMRFGTGLRERVRTLLARLEIP